MATKPWHPQVTRERKQAAMLLRGSKLRIGRRCSRQQRTKFPRWCLSSPCFGPRQTRSNRQVDSGLPPLAKQGFTPRWQQLKPSRQCSATRLQASTHPWSSNLMDLLSGGSTLSNSACNGLGSKSPAVAWMDSGIPPWHGRTGTLNYK